MERKKDNIYKYEVINDIDDLNIINIKLLNKKISNYWGQCLKFEMVESISFFDQISFDEAEKEVNNYFKLKNEIFYKKTNERECT